MSLYEKSNTGLLIGTVVVVILAMSVWCGKTLWEQMKSDDAETRMRSIQAAIRLYANDSGALCPEDFGVLLEKGYCKDSSLFVLELKPGERPLDASALRAGRSDFGYLGKGMRLSEAAMNGGASRGDDSHSFPLLYTKAPFHGNWIVVYSDGHPTVYSEEPGFLKLKEPKARNQWTAQPIAP